MLLDVVAVAALAACWRSPSRTPAVARRPSRGWPPPARCWRSVRCTLDAAGEQVERMLPVVLFLAAILVVAETCAAEGLFAAVGDAVRRAGRGDPHRVLLVGRTWPRR